jgi:uncharacterized membrane protein YvlD (DUF360 family)
VLFAAGRLLVAVKVMALLPASLMSVVVGVLPASVKPVLVVLVLMPVEPMTAQPTSSCRCRRP